MKTPWRHCLLVVLIALVARLAYALLVTTPAFRDPADNMSRRLVRGGYALAAGLGYSESNPDSPEAKQAILHLVQKGERGEPITEADAVSVPRHELRPTTIHPPGWAMLGAGLHRLTGLPIRSSMRNVGIVADVAAAVLVYLLVLTCFSHPPAAFLSAMLYAVFPPLAGLASFLYPPVFTNGLVILVVYLIVLAAKSTGPRQAWLLVSAGVVQGTAAYFRSDYLLLAPFLAMGLWAHTGRFRWSIAAGVGMFAVSVVMLIPWAVRNHRAYGQWDLMCTTFGGTAINGLAMYPNPWGFERGDEARMSEAAAQGIDDPFGPEGNVYFKAVLYRAIREHPKEWAMIVGRRLVEGVIAPQDWGLKPVGRDRPLSKIVAEGELLKSIPYVLKVFWPYCISALVTLTGSLCCVVMVWKEGQNRALAFLLALVPVYAILSHSAIMMANYYVMPGLFVQLTAQAYVVCRTWNRENLTTEPSPGAVSQPSAGVAS